MTPDGPESETPLDRAEVYAELSQIDAASRTELVLRLVEMHPAGRLELPAQGSLRAKLDGINLGREHLQSRFADAAPLPGWWSGEHQAMDLRGANLQGASLRHAHLHGALLEEANLAEADLAEANLRGAVLAGANLRGTLLEDADLHKAVLRFAQAPEGILEGAKLQGADLWGANLQGAVLAGADLQGATLEEADLRGANLTEADLRGANLKRANLQGANLRGADLRGAALGHTVLDEAVLRDAQLQELRLTECSIKHVHTSGAVLERTRLDQEQFGGAIGEELRAEYEPARKGYLALERNFEELGDHDAASWAYRRRRRMEKLETLDRVRAAWRERRLAEVVRYALEYGSDQLVEWVCDYGESIPRVFGSLLAVYFLFIPIYGMTATVLRVEETPGGVVKTPTFDPADLALFSLTAMTSPGNPPQWLTARNALGFSLAGLQTLLSIFLTGLLGFVTGNRIRR